MTDSDDTETESEHEPIFEGQTVTDSLSEYDDMNSEDAEAVRSDPDDEDNDE